MHNILSGTNEVNFGAIIQAIAGYLNGGEKASATIEDEKHFKKKRSREVRKTAIKILQFPLIFLSITKFRE